MRTCSKRSSPRRTPPIRATARCFGARSDEAVERAYRDWLDHAIDVSVELVERGVARGHTPPMPVRDVTRALTQMNANYLLDLVARDPEFDPDTALEALWTVWARTTWP